MSVSSAMSRPTPRVANTAASLVLLAALVTLSACEGEEEKGEGRNERGGDSRAQVTVADTTQCAMSSTLLNNRTDRSYNVHVQVKNKCSGPGQNESIGPAYQPARLKVLDKDGNVVNGQDITIPSMGTEYSILGVTPGARIVLECGKGMMTVRTGCIWSYSYSP